MFATKLFQQYTDRTDIAVIHFPVANTIYQNDKRRRNLLYGRRQQTRLLRKFQITNYVSGAFHFAQRSARNSIAQIALDAVRSIWLTPNIKGACRQPPSSLPPLLSINSARPSVIQKNNN